MAVPSEKAAMQGISSVSIRSKIIPALALTLVVLLLALLAWAVLVPHSQTVSENGRIDAPGQFVPITGRTAPTFQVADFSGKQLSLSDYRGKVVLVNFWASWCDACKDEAPLLSRVSGTLDGQNAVIIGMDSLDNESAGRDFAKQYGISYTNGSDDSGSVAVDYGVSGMPETFVISPTGKLVGKFYGAITAPDQVTDAIKRASGA